MIRYTALRDNGGGMSKMSEYEQSASQALESLVVYELGYGGRVSSLSLTKIVIETQILGVKDKTIFEGSENEMAFLVKVAALHASLMNKRGNRDMFIEKAASFLDELSEGVRGNTLLVTTLAPFILGSHSATVALLLGASVTEEETLKSLIPISLKDLTAAVALHLETAMPLPEIVSEMKLGVA